MFIDLKKKTLTQKLYLKKLNKLYDYIIIGSGPASSVLLNNLLRIKKKILVIERGGFEKLLTTNIVSDDLQIKKTSRNFGVGGTSNTWSQIYSLLAKTEMKNLENKNTWPLSHKDLTKWCKKVGSKYKFNLNQIGSELIYKNKFYSRKFIENKYPLRFSKYFIKNKKKFDMITNCKVQFIDETKKFSSIFFTSEKQIHSIRSKKIIICAGGIESNLLILNSLKNRYLKNLKNKKFIGRFFMDHPKCYIGEIKYPKKNLIQKIKLKYKERVNMYSGISLFKENQRTLNTYVRFEEKKKFFNLKKKMMLRIFLEMEPRFKNRIYIKNKINKVDLSISSREIEISKKLLNEILQIFSYKPQNEKIEFNQKNLIGASHHMGGLCYPKIVDKNLKLQGLKNIYCCSSAIFPTSGSVNPTLIICALSERLSSHLMIK